MFKSHLISWHVGVHGRNYIFAWNASVNYEHDHCMCT